ncbi:uncharacterized protein SCODWIG_03610 [Saccharomycodes ludwigii]|uniref:F-box/LRR-repeat protein 15-like leucin rich repeat domain-containing protein n=2 Tax=Saccharomycodes ludwigii TaxID=36035 RepID=A0A376BB84_9ASCO|nr:uncharacterized protein SCODWIG_03610 [Saccharomycodes ludwigii]
MEKFDNGVYGNYDNFVDNDLTATNSKNRNNIGCKKLKKLTLRHCKSLTDETLKHIVYYAFDRIEHLDLTRCTGISDNGFRFWKQPQQRAGSFNNLETLILSECVFLTDDTIFSLTTCCPVLKYLNLSFCFSITDASLEVICLGLPLLEKLDVSFCGRAVSNASLLSISMHLRNLQKIWLKGCLRVTRSGVDSLLGGFAPLTFVDISQCRNAHMYQNGIMAERFQTTVPGGKKALIKIEENGGRVVEVII